MKKLLTYQCGTDLASSLRLNTQKQNKLRLNFLSFSLRILVCSLFLSACAGHITYWQQQNYRRILLNDRQININIEKKLNSDRIILETSHIKVMVDNGNVLLIGESPSAKIRASIIAMIQTVANIKQIHNALEITQPTTASTQANDLSITNNVKLAFVKAKNLAGFNLQHMKIMTANSKVYLFGRVNKSTAHVVTEMARRVAGVKKIIILFEYID